MAGTKLDNCTYGILGLQKEQFQPFQYLSSSQEPSGRRGSDSLCRLILYLLPYIYESQTMTEAPWLGDCHKLPEKIEDYHGGATYCGQLF